PAGRDRAGRLRRMDHRRRARRAPPRGLAPDAATLRPCRVARRARTTHHHLMARPAVHPPLPRCEAADRPADENVPADQCELVIATAWRLVEEGQTVLVFCPKRNSVEPYARAIIKVP